MNYKIIVVENFQREAKRLVKKYASLKDELFNLEKNLAQNPRLGTPLGKSIYKIRLAVKSKGKGKSGGVRVITRIVEILIENVEQDSQTDIYLLSIYDKSEQANISDKAIKELIESLIK